MKHDFTRVQNNILGNIRAEHDSNMLQQAFYESHDYNKLIKSSDLNLIVGRRGTGKSALVWKLSCDMSQEQGTALVSLAPEESQIHALRDIFSLFGPEFTRVRAAAKIAWKYAVFMEIIHQLRFDKKVIASDVIQVNLKKWNDTYGGTSSKIREVLKKIVVLGATPGERIGDLAKHLQIREITENLSKALIDTKRQIIVLIDRLDEGYEPDDLGTAIVDGLVQSTIDLESCIPASRAYIFLRDNIFRAIARLDKDYSRNIEGQLLRLHWDESQLFSLVCNRLRIAFHYEELEDRPLWNRCTDRGLQGMDGFKKCLQFTLYRPRDVLSLLNKAFVHASDHNRKQIIEEDIRFTAREISEARKDDLIKEYENNFPGLFELVSTFSNRNPELSFKEACLALKAKLTSDTFSQDIQRDFLLIEQPEQAIRILYGIGFLGLKNERGNFVFCHDGKSPDREITQHDQLLVHPCYWMALNLTRDNLNIAEATEIYDEYDIEINQTTKQTTSEIPEIQRKGIGRLMAELDKIPIGETGAQAFEDWCLRSLQVLFAGALRNFSHHPNGDAVQRRDIIASNTGEKGENKVWERILQDYGTRQVIFEVKNYKALGPTEYRQAATYLTAHYGRLCFIVNRETDCVLRTGKELDGLKEIYHTQNQKLIVKLPAGYIVKLLSKLRSREKRNAPLEALSQLLDMYERNYLSLKSSKNRKKK